MSVGFALAPAATTAAASGPAAPFVIAGSLAASALMAWLARKGPRQKIQSTQIVDEIEPLMAANRDQFMAGARTAIDQAAALAQFDELWGAVYDACSDPALGNPGRACIADRRRGGRWDWFALYRDPIEREPLRAVPGFTAGGIDLDDSLLIPVALLAVGALL